MARREKSRGARAKSHVSRADRAVWGVRSIGEASLKGLLLSAVQMKRRMGWGGREPVAADELLWAEWPGTI